MQDKLKSQYHYSNGELHNEHGRSIGGFYPKSNAKYKKAYAFGKNHFIHRLIWIYHNGDIPAGRFVDHINRNKLDNNIENLRLVDRSENAMNTGLRSDNKSGYKNISPTKDNFWRLEICRNQKIVFSKRFKTLEEAVERKKQLCL